MLHIRVENIVFAAGLQGHSNDLCGKTGLLAGGQNGSVALPVGFEEFSNNRGYFFHIHRIWQRNQRSR